jgi:hypothetical protein
MGFKKILIKLTVIVALTSFCAHTQAWATGKPMLMARLASQVRSPAKPGAPSTFDVNSEPHPSEDPAYNAKIDFSSHELPLIHYADVSVPDPLQFCPIDDAEQDLKTAINNLVSQVSIEINLIKSNRATECTNLQNQMSSTQTALNSAVTNQFLSSSAIPPSATQLQINQATQQATAVNSLFLTTSSLLNNNCISRMSKKVVIQKLIGQVITVGGIFAGGWGGVAAAAGGQFFANLPIFLDRIDEAVEALKKDEARKNRISFLCLYRQMLKTSCMIYSTPQNRFINGLDITFKTGPGFTTAEEIKQIENKNPELFKDVQTLRDIDQSSKTIRTQLNQEALQKGSLEAFQSLKTLCSSSKLEEFHADANYHPRAIVDALNSIREICTNLNQFEYPKELKKAYSPSLQVFYDHLQKLIDYYNSLKSDENHIASYIVKTWESQQYLSSLQSSIIKYQNTSSGNLARSNYLSLVKRLGKLVGRPSFKSIMRRNHKVLTEHYRIGNEIPTDQPIHSTSIRSNALISMLKACQTLDPTLTCLYPDAQAPISTQTEWMLQCVGPKSVLCEGVIRRKEKHKLLPDPKLRAYFNSLCGTTDDSDLDPLDREVVQEI